MPITVEGANIHFEVYIYIVMAALVFLFCQFVAFNYVINGFIFIAT